MKVFMTRKNSDMTEGRGRMVNDACFMHKTDANDHIDGKSGIMGRKEKWSTSNSGDWDVEEIEVYESSIEFAEQEKQKLRTSGMAKLSKAEIDALGLK